MDKIFRLTSSEYAKLIGISNEALRSRRRRNQEEGNYKKVGSDYFWMTPLAGRPNMAVTVANDRGPRYGIPVKNVKRKRRRGVVARGEQTNYHEAPNGWQLEQANQIKALGKIRDGLGDEVVDDRTDFSYLVKDLDISPKRDATYQKPIKTYKDF